MNDNKLPIRPRLTNTRLNIVLKVVFSDKISLAE